VMVSVTISQLVENSEFIKFPFLEGFRVSFELGFA